jgi:hypothetical protein
MVDFIAGVGVVASALVQEGVSRVVSFVLGKGEEQVSQEHNAERLKMALSALELALERTGKLPITDVSLIRRWHKFKHAYIEGRDLLNKHTMQAQEEIEQGVKRRKCWKDIFFSSVSSPGGAGLISTDDVRRFAWLADCADKFVRDVETGCSLRHYTFCSPLVRHLLQGKILTSEVDEGTRLRRFYMRSVCVEGRGVETLLGYHYDDRETAEKGFALNLILRLSESTDIVGITIKCLQSVVSQFKQVNRTAMGELTLLANLQDDGGAPSLPSSSDGRTRRRSRKHAPPVFRPDPVCCKGDGHGPCANNVVSPSLANVFPEQVIYFGYHYCVPGPELHCSSANQAAAAKSLVRRRRRQPPGMRVAFLHYFAINKQQDSYTLGATASRENSSQVLRYDNLQQVTAEAGSSEKVNCLLLQPELTEHHISWFSKHGLGCFHMPKTSTGERAAGASRTTKTARKRKQKAIGN